MKEYRLYLFDFDDTLFDTQNSFHAILKKALPAVGVEYRRDMLPGLKGLNFDHIFYRMVADPARYDTFMEEAMKVATSDAYLDAAPFSDTLITLQGLKSRGKPIGIVSGKMKYKIERLMSDFDMGSYPDFIVGYYETERHKPEPDPLMLALSHFGIPKEDVLYIGDSTNDVLCAKNCGVDCAVIERFPDPESEIPPSTYRIRSLTEVLDC